MKKTSNNDKSNSNSTTKPLLRCMLVAHDIDKQVFSISLLAIGEHGAHLVIHDRLIDGGNSAKDMGEVPLFGCEVFSIFKSSVHTKTGPKKKVRAGVRTVTDA